MIPGPDRVIACPSCGALAKHGTLVSGNTFGARLFTDGKQVAPMLPQPPAVVRCHRCRRFYWLEAAEGRGVLEAYSPSPGPDADAIPEVEEPTEDEYYQALEEGLAASPEEERTLRLLAMWRRNDAFREEQQLVLVDVTSPPEWRGNLEALNVLVDEESDDDRLLKAEVLRELGEFAAAAEILRRVESPQYVDVVRQMLSLCESGDTHVRELSLSGRGRG